KLYTISKNFQDEIYRIMNPKNCEEALFFMCHWKSDNKWGFGSITQHILFCLSMAVKLKRVLVLQVDTMAPDDWFNYFQPPSGKCSLDSISFDAYRTWPKGEKGNTPEIFNISGSEFHKSKLIKLTLPRWNFTNFDKFVPYGLQALAQEDIGKLRHTHRCPEIWSLGQYAKYLFRLQPDFEKSLSVLKTRLGYNTNTIGIHIRRGDKIKKVPYTSIEKYISTAEEYFTNKNSSGGRRSVYIASDEGKIFKELSEKYPDFTFVYNNNETKYKRKRTDMFNEIITDVILLAQADYFIGTYSSNIGRLVHQLRQGRYIDGTCASHSLDMEYFYVACCGIKMLNMPSNCQIQDASKLQRVI
ncbi:unnamed protein product, partial [Owenia fusiformis]